jgi:outer membrane protein with beta-barrel domain
MIGKVTAVAAMVALVGTSAWAQEHRVEIGGVAGYTASDGVSGQSILAGDGNLYNRIDPKDSFSWGLSIGYLLNENSELEFLYDQQMSTLQASGTTTKDIGDFSIKGYHGVYAYNFGETDAKARPFLFIGAGATSYPGISFTRANGQPGEIGGNTKFSGTFGLGVKVYPGKNAGLRLQARWTPTYIKSDSAGYWCDPYWGCYVVGNAQYSNQFAFQGGITFKF